MNINTVTFVAPNLACGEARGGRIPRSGAVTDEQRSHRPNSAQPSGRQFFLAQASLLAPHRPPRGMLVARASPAPKIPCRERHRIYVHDHLVRCVFFDGHKSRCAFLSFDNLFTGQLLGSFRTPIRSAFLPLSSSEIEPFMRLDWIFGHS